MLEFIMVSIIVGWAVFHPVELVGYFLAGVASIVIMILVVYWMLYPLINSI